LLPRGGAETERIEREVRPGSPGGFLLRLPVIAARFARANLGFGRRVLELDTAFAAECARIEAIDFRILSASGLDETLSDVQRLLERSGTMLLTAYAGLLAALVPLRAALDLLCAERASDVQSALLSAIEAEESDGAEAPSARAKADAALASLPLPARPPLRVLLAAVRGYVRLRERLRARVAQVLGLFRLIASDASRRLAVREPDIQRDAALFLTLDEVHGVLRGEIRTAAPLVRRRWLQYERDCGLPDPPATFIGYPPPPGPEVAPLPTPEVGERGRVADDFSNAQRLRA
jgi:pyruvate,water dikinase